MAKKSKHTFWFKLAIVLSILFILFISLFALDVFGEPLWYIGLLVHLIPSFVLTILTIISSKNGLIGGILMIIAGFFATFFFHSILLFIPMFIVGSLFLLDWKLTSKG